MGLNTSGPLRLSFHQRIKSQQKIGAASGAVDGLTPASRGTKPITTFDSSQKRLSIGKKQTDVIFQATAKQVSVDVSKKYTKFVKEPNRDLDLVVQETVSD